MDYQDQNSYELNNQRPQKDLTTFGGWTALFIFSHIAGMLLSMLSCGIAFEWLGVVTVITPYVLIMAVLIALRVIMLLLLANRNRLFRVFYYIEFGLNVVFCVQFAVAGVFELGDAIPPAMSIIWLFYVIYSDRLKFITGELPKKDPSVWNHSPQASLNKRMVPVGTVQQPDSTTPSVAPPQVTNVARVSQASSFSPAHDTRFCKRCGAQIDPTSTQCVKCGARTQLFAKKRANRTILIVLAVLLAASVCGNAFLGISVYQYDNNIELWKKNSEEQIIENRQLRNRLNDIENSRNEWKNAYTAIQPKAQILDQYIAFVPDDGTALYHTYDCPLWSGSYWIYVVEDAQYNGFSSCSHCH